MIYPRKHLLNLLLTSLFIVMVFLGVFPASTNAAPDASERCKLGAGNFVPLECFEGSAKLADAYATENLKDFLNKIFIGAISIGAILAVLRLAWAGYEYMASDLWTKKETAREIIKDVLLGLFLLLAVYIILKQINPQILDLKVEVGSTQTSQQ